MPTTYEYAKKDGTLGQLQAEDDAGALAVLGGLADRAPNTGVSKSTALGGVPEATPATAYKDFNYGANTDSEADRTYQALLGGAKKAATTKIDSPEQAYQKKLKQYQAEIDATNNIYAQILADTKQQGMGRLGSSRAIQARGGLLGSDFGAAQTDTIGKSNLDAENLVRAEQQAKIASILGTARKAAVDELAEKRAAQKQGADDYLSYLKGSQERKVSKAKKLASTLIAQGLDVKDVDPAQLKKIASDYGLSVDEVMTTYTEEKTALDLKQKEADAKAMKDNSFELGEGQSYYQYDPKTGTYKEIASKGKTYAPRASSGGGGASGGSGGGSGAYGSDLDALIGATLSTIPSKFGQATFSNQISRARNDADKISLVAAQVLQGAPAAAKTDFTNQAVGISEIDKAIKLLDDGAKTGVLEAGGQYVFNLAGRDFDPKLAQINSHLISAIQPYRNSITGAAWGNQEDGEYQALFGSTKYSPTELKQRLKSVKEILKNKSAQGLNSYVNPLGYYDNQFDNAGAFEEGDGVRATIESLDYDYDALKSAYPTLSDSALLEMVQSQ